MHSPRLQMVRKKTEPLRPLDSVTDSDMLRPQQPMTSEAISGLLGRYGVMAVPEASSQEPESTQDIARIAVALYRKPDVKDPKDLLYENVGPRVFDYMKKPQLELGGVVGASGAIPPSTRKNDGSPRGPAPRSSNAIPQSLAPLPQYASPPRDTQPVDGYSRFPAIAALSNSGRKAPLPPPPPQHGPLIKHAPYSGTTAVANNNNNSPLDTHTKYIPIRSGNSVPTAPAPQPKPFQQGSEALSLVPSHTEQVGQGTLTIVRSPDRTLHGYGGQVMMERKEGADESASTAALLQQIEEASAAAHLVGSPPPLEPLSQESLAGEAEAKKVRNAEMRSARLQELLTTTTSPLPQGADEAHHSMGAKVRLELGRVRNQIALLCQQAAALMIPPSAPAASSAEGGDQHTASAVATLAQPHPPAVAEPPALEVVIMERGSVVWRSGDEDVSTLRQNITALHIGGIGSALTSPQSNAIDPMDDEQWLLSDGGSNDETLDAVKSRARKAYAKAMAAFKAKMAQQRDTIAKLKTQIESTQPGGGKFQQLEEDLLIVREECRRQMGKIRTLVNLLDRAGQTIRFHENQRNAEVLGNVMRRENAAPWHQVRRIIPGLDVEPPRTDAQILQDIMKFMDAQEDRLHEYSSNTEQLTNQLEEVQGAFDALQRTHKSVQRDFEQTRYELETLRQRRRYELEEQRSNLGGAGGGGGIEGADAVTTTATRSSLSTQNPQDDIDRMHLIEKITALESALKSTTESKGYLQAVGMSLEVPPFLRVDEPRVRNINLSKMAVENIINGVWLTRFLPSISQSRPLLDCKWIVKDGPPAAVVPDFNKGGPIVKSLERMFILAVQSVFAGGGTGTSVVDSSAPSDGSPTSPGRGLLLTAKRDADAISGASGSDNGQGLVLDPDRHPACEFTDDNNISFWLVKRSEAKRMVNFLDHMTRFLLECIDPNGCKTCLTLYTVPLGITTPPIGTLQWQKRCDLFLQSPQFPSLARPGVPMPMTVAEVAYSLMDGCEKFSFDGDVSMFRHVVQGDICESAYFDMMLMIEKLRVAMMNSNSMFRAPHAANVPTVFTVLQMLKRFFPRKNPSSLAHLQHCLVLDIKETAMSTDAASVSRLIKRMSTTNPGEGSTNESGGGLLSSDSSLVGGAENLELPQEALRSPIDVAKLFSATESGNQGHFLDALKSQYIAELLRYTEDVKGAIIAASSETALNTSSDQQPMTVLEKSKKRRQSVAAYFQQQQQSTAGASDTQAAVATIIEPRQAAIRIIADKLLSIDPAKSMPEIENYLYHVVQLYLLKKTRNGGHLSGAETEYSTMTREEFWKRQTRVSSMSVVVDEFVKYCPMVLYRRAGVDMFSSY